MGCLFLISGYLTPASFDRKGPRRFLIDRVVRLGIPMLFYDLVIHPFLIYWLASHGVYNLSLPGLGSLVLHVIPPRTRALWFVEALLLFSVVYVVWRLLTSDSGKTVRTATNRAEPSASMRLPLPPGGERHAERLVLWWSWRCPSGSRPSSCDCGNPSAGPIEPLNFQFPFFPQYIVMFILGIRGLSTAVADAAARRAWAARH